MLLPTRSSTASSRLASAIRLDRSGPSCSTRLDAQRLEQGVALAAAGGGDDPRARVDRHVDGRLPEGRCRPADQQRLALGDFEIAEQARPGGGIGLRDRRQLGPRQV